MAALAAGADDGGRSLLERILAFANPEAGLADELIDRFGSVGALLSASYEAKAEASSCAVAALLDGIEAMQRHLLTRRIEERPLLASSQALLDYLHGTMAHRMTESARVLHLNTKNVLIRDEQVSEGSIDQAAIYIREVARRALELHSAAIILVHNHPSGDPSPSRQDIQLTREMIAALKPLAVTVHDHVIIGASGHASMRAQGII